MDPSSNLTELAKGFRVRVRPAVRLAAWASFFAALVFAGLLARRGSFEARLGAGLLIALIFLGFLLRGVLERRALRRRQLIVRRLVLGEDRTLAERVLRALALAERAEHDPSVGSYELAKLHVRRAVGRIPATLVARRGSRVARRFRTLGLVVGSIGALAFGLEPPRVFEGLDVLVARRGLAPVDMAWLEALTVVVQPPLYLRNADSRVDPSSAAVPRGSVLVVRGLPIRPGRRLILSDGQLEVPFLDDGDGGLVARWTLEKDAELRVAARFGAVLVREPEPIKLHAIPDEVPAVELAGAPRRVELESLDRLELRYEVSDDHGLRQIDLVLRSGGREERRVLEKLDGQAKSEQGAQALDPSDPFFLRAFLPIEVSIEAKDNDVLAGDKWGKSAAITLVPPAIGGPEAARFRALAEARGAVVDFLAYLMEHESELSKAGLRPEIARRRAEAVRTLREALSGAYAGARVGSGLQSFLRGQAGRLEKPPAKKTPIAALEDSLLAIDSAIRSLGTRDAQAVAKRLGDAADEAADGFAKARETENRRGGLARAAVALGVLDMGAENLAALDALGADLGSVTRGELRRIRRAEQAQSLLHAELAARHLAARLRRPTPSFGSAGGAGSAGGVEAGEHSGSPGSGSTPPSDADKRFDQMADELDGLIREHGALTEQVEGSLSEANAAAKSDELRREAAERAEALRQALEGLPRPGAREGSGRAAASLAREHAAAMAERLERLELGEASESGRTARGLAEEARQKALSPQSASDLSDPTALERARQEIEKQLAWAEQTLQKTRRDAEQAARERLGEAAEQERSIERRMGELAERAEQSEAALPEEQLGRLGQARDIMKEAAGELGGGRGERGLELQREAQRLLEQGSSGRTSDSDGHDNKSRGRDETETGGRGMTGKAAVPGAPGKNAAAEFRRRVLEGLGKERAGRLEPAIRRYAEGLLE
jgi:hypothetical protein